MSDMVTLRLTKQEFEWLMSRLTEPPKGMANLQELYRKELVRRST